MLELRTFGGLSVQEDGAPGSGAGAQRKTLALLALLAAHPRGLSRDKIAAYLWPDSDSKHSRGLLKQACYALRRDLHTNRLFLGSSELRLNPAFLTSDVQAFEDALHTGDYARAADLYAGAFLDGFFLREATEFEGWVEVERGRLTKEVCDVFEKLANRCAAAGDHQAAQRWWRRLATLEPLSSRAALGVMTALAERGEIPEALRHGKAYEALVRDELGAPPEPAVADVLNRLQHEPAAAEGVTGDDLRLAMSSGGRRTVGYEKQRGILREGFRAAVAGRGLMMCVAGEPGSGKTTLIEDLLGEVVASGRVSHITRGRCSERLAGSGAYLPLLDALESLLRADTRGAIAHLMQQHAPNWYAQVAPALQPVGQGKAPQVQAASQERLKRELNTFFREVCRLRPLVVFLDDVHWVDASTVDIMSYVANQMNTAQMLIIATYRPSELQLAKHPFGALKLHLQGEGVCQELTLELLTSEDVAHFLELEFPQHHFPPRFAQFLHAKTEGSPLFMVDLVRYLRAKQVIVPDNGGWKLSGSVPDLERELPESARSMIERKIEQLAEDDRQLLTAASVQGYEFDSAIVTQALSASAAKIEERLDTLDRVHGLVRPLRELAFPDGTPAIRYRFVHVLYQNALYARLAPTRRATLSREVAEALLGHYGDRSVEVAAELALLLEMARDFPRAVEYFALAAERAADVYAHGEAVTLAERGLKLLRTLPDSPERVGRELGIQLRLGYSLMFSKGYTHPESGTAMTRAREICHQLGDSAQLFPAVNGVWAYHLVSAEMLAARDVATELLRMAEKSQDRLLLCGAHIAMGASLHHTAELPASDQHFRAGLEFYDPTRHAEFVAIFRQDWRVYGRGEWLRVLWLLGYPDRALACLQESFALAQEIPEQTDIKWPLIFGALLHQHRREPERCLELAEQTVAHGEEHGLDAHVRWGTSLRGWALAELGALDDGIQLMQESLLAHRAIRQMIIMPYWLALLAEQFGKRGEVEKGLATIEEGLGVLRETFQPFYEAELHRLRGQLLLLRADIPAAESALHEALAIARRQEAKSLELRAAASLARLWKLAGKQDDARNLLAPLCGWFTEGLDTPDLQDAKALLQELS
jgi:DNA-binding SARP family transcriptional activator/predicted ATPase